MACDTSFRSSLKVFMMKVTFFFSCTIALRSIDLRSKRSAAVYNHNPEILHYVELILMVVPKLDDFGEMCVKRLQLPSGKPKKTREIAFCLAYMHIAQREIPCLYGFLEMAMFQTT